MRALISVSDKTGIVEFARALAARGVEIVSTGGTATLLARSGIAVVEIADYTGFPEMLDGRVKTLHPKVHGGLLARRDHAAHMDALETHGIATIDLLVVNLYPFEATVAQEGCTLADAIENIDIGGPAMVRSAAKNWNDVAVVTDPSQYATVLDELATHGAVLPTTRFSLAVQAFNRIAEYDGAISDYLSSLDGPACGVPARHEFPSQLNLRLVKVQDLRYGENPHQRAALYRETKPARGSLVGAEQLQGKELSYNNLADADAAWECVTSFPSPACVIVKHANPAGVALGRASGEAYARAFATDPTSAFGGIIAFNAEVDRACAEQIARQFVEVLVAPSYTEEALAVFAAKANTRVLRVALPDAAEASSRLDCKRIGSGLLVQSADQRLLDEHELRVVTKLQPTPEQMRDLRFAWTVAKYVKSNAIVFAKGEATLGVGAGQMSRLDSARIASIKAEAAGLALAGSAVASDAFFPFRDGLDVVVDAGATCVIQPGGSVRDAEVIAAADERGIAMAFTGMRHFRH